jgi:hypothetical protein
MDLWIKDSDISMNCLSSCRWLPIEILVHMHYAGADKHTCISLSCQLRPSRTMTLQSIT